MIHWLFGVPSTLPEMLYILRHGDDVPLVRDQIYNEVSGRMNNIYIWWQCKRLARTPFNPGARYLGIMMFGDQLEFGKDRHLMARCRKVLRALKRTERDPRNKKLIEDSLNTDAVSGMAKRLTREGWANVFLRQQKKAAKGG